MRFVMAPNVGSESVIEAVKVTNTVSRLSFKLTDVVWSDALNAYSGSRIEAQPIALEPTFQHVRQYICPFLCILRGRLNI